MNFIFSKAYAKINLALDISGTDEKGYHLIKSVMVPVNFYDEIFICNEKGIDHLDLYTDKSTGQKFAGVFEEMKENDLCCYLAGNVKLTENYSDNIAYRAADLFLRETGIKEKLFIFLNKHIFIGGGLGGSSTDGACVLKTLNIMFGHPLSEEKLYEAASELGSDVPFFLSGGPALATGTGTVIKRLHAFPKMHYTIVYPRFSSSTSLAYKTFDGIDIPKEARPDIDALLKDIYRGNIKAAGRNMKNVLECAVFNYYPKIADLKEEMASLPGVLASFMSGSGSTVVGVFDSEENSLKAKEYFKDKKLIAKSCS